MEYTCKNCSTRKFSVTLTIPGSVYQRICKNQHKINLSRFFFIISALQINLSCYSCFPQHKGTNKMKRISTWLMNGAINVIVKPVVAVCYHEHMIYLIVEVVDNGLRCLDYMSWLKKINLSSLVKVPFELF